MNNYSTDKIEVLPCGSIIQHGFYNNRIYLLKHGKNATESLPINLIEKAKHFNYSKIFAKIPSRHYEQFISAGYIEEAAIPGFYNGSEKGLFMSFYLNKQRSLENDADNMDIILNLALEKSGESIAPFDTDQFILRRCKQNDIEEMASIYRAVFPTYPFPIYNPEYLLDTMKNNVVYFAVECNKYLIALSSAEIDNSSQNAEMTDFATLPQWQKNSLGCHMLLQMEKEMKKQKIKTTYTISRAASIGINIIFAKLGYKYGGRLKNNTNISGKIESMNVWYKAFI